MQTTLELPMGIIELPEIVLGPIKYDIGHAFCVLRSAQKAEVINTETISITSRTKVECLYLDNGEKLIVTDRKKIQLPDGVDGSIKRDEEGKYHWNSHRILEKQETLIAKEGLRALAARAQKSWRNNFHYVAEQKDGQSPKDLGLRPPQLGALFSIGSHWSLHHSTATVVMPTGTGKTETMLATLAAHQIPSLLVAVPSKALRQQTADKFKTFGLLRKLNVLDNEAINPVVGIVLRRPKSEEELKIFEDCNVIVGTVPSLAGGTAAEHLPQMAEKIDTLIVDEAHHVKAATWEALRSAFSKGKVLQFTATPFRGDGKLVDGTVIYSYPLKSAQEDGYFKKIKFIPVRELDEEKSDEKIAAGAVAQLREDMRNGYNHFLMARCRTTDRAQQVFEIYKKMASDLNPVLIHSELDAVDERIEHVRSGVSKIVVCVNMLGEGVDIPQLKVAAVHDKHQSLAVLLQFIGRITRSSGDALGDASVIANVADPRISLALEELYGEDSDWNKILSELSSEAAKDHAELIRFLEQSNEIEMPESDLPGISLQSLKPIFSTLFYNAEEFHPKRFHSALPEKQNIVRVWLNEESKTIFFVTRSDNKVKWSRSKEVQDIEWNLFILHHDDKSKILYLASTSKASNFELMAKAVGATSQISGEMIFKSLGHIGRLVFNNLGVTKPGRRNLSYAMYTGADVKNALTETERHGSRKSNVSGYGWENGKKITIGCSYKGRVWSKDGGTIPEFIKWAEGIGRKLVDPTIDTKSVIENVLIPEFAETLPDCEVLGLDWPAEILSQSEERVVLVDGQVEHHLFMLDIHFKAINRAEKTIDFEIAAGEDGNVLASYKMTVKGKDGFEIALTSQQNPTLRIGNRDVGELKGFLTQYPPLVRFVDLSELDGNVLLSSENPLKIKLKDEQFNPWNWDGTDITKESIWKKGVERKDSIQWRVAQHYIQEGFSVVFDDDGSGEAADLICIKLEDDHIKLSLIHCKFSGSSNAGVRINDVVEVASQAVRSARWPGRFKHLIKHIENRLTSRRSTPQRKLFLEGGSKDLRMLVKATRLLEVRPEVLIVQPGISKARITDDQSTVLAAAASYLKQTLNIELKIICSE